MLWGRTGFRAAMIASACLVAAGAAQAAGAIAIGACGAYGHAYDFPNMTEAKAAARAKCEGACKDIVVTQRGCAAFAVDVKSPCGAYGYASASRLGRAQNQALRHCYKHGGRDCMIRAWICDGRS